MAQTTPAFHSVQGILPRAEAYFDWLFNTQDGRKASAMALLRANPMNNDDLAQGLGIAKGSASKLVDELIADGLARRERYGREVRIFA